jgi:acyl-CoA synthetase (AMP-forming)/AMP-acid ligase II
LQSSCGATIQEITRGRCAAIAVPDEGTEQLVVIIEVRKRGDSDEEVMDKLGLVKREVTSAISNSHGLAVADLVLVAPGSIPVATSGKVRQAASVCRAVPARSVRPLRRIGSTGVRSADEICPGKLWNSRRCRALRRRRP